METGHKYTGTGQNCTKTKLYEVTKLHEGTKLHENKIVRVHKISRRYFCTKANLPEGTKLHEDHFAPRINFARDLKTKRKKSYLPRVRVRGKSDNKYKI